MKLDEIEEIRIENDEKMINNLLKKGFRIQKILQSKSDNELLSPCFILAKN